MQSLMKRVLHSGDERQTGAADRSGRRGGEGAQGRCQVEGCDVELCGAKAYYSRHRVCVMHSKSPTVTVDGARQRFCQQCGRFHQLFEFDGGKRSCRRRLANHNQRRRKPTTHKSLLPNCHGGSYSTRAENSSCGGNGFTIDLNLWPMSCRPSTAHVPTEQSNPTWFWRSNTSNENPPPPPPPISNVERFNQGSSTALQTFSGSGGRSPAAEFVRRLTEPSNALSLLSSQQSCGHAMAHHYPNISWGFESRRSASGANQTIGSLVGNNLPHQPVGRLDVGPDTYIIHEAVGHIN